METKSWIEVTIGLAALANVLQMAGFVAPMWIWLDVGFFRVAVGLWIATGCGIKGTCNTAAPSVSFGYTADDTFDQPDFKAVQGLQTIGTAGATLLLLLLILYRLGYGKWRYLRELNLAAFVICLITWLCILTGVVVYCGSYWPVVGTSPLLNSGSFPWSLLLCFFAGLLFIAVCLLIRLKCCTSEFVKHAIPISGDAHMDLHPVTKQGFWHRYFTPAYHETRRPNYAVGLQNEGTGITGMNGRLLEGGREPSVIAIDNMAFDGSALETGVAYRYLPRPTVDAIPHPQPPPQPALTQSLPPPVITYTDVNAHDFSRFQQTADYAKMAAERNRRAMEDPLTNRYSLDPPDPTYAPGRNRTVMDGPSAPRNGLDTTNTDSAVVRKRQVIEEPLTSRDVAMDHVTGGMTRDVSGFYNDGVVMRDVTYHTRYATPQRSFLPPGMSASENVTQVERQESRKTLTGPIVTSSRSYVAGVTDPPRDLLKDNSMDSRFTRDGRLTANADYLSVEFRNGDRPQSQVGSNYSSNALQYTTHVGPLGPATRSVVSGGGGASLFQSSYIYRPSSLQMY